MRSAISSLFQIRTGEGRSTLLLVVVMLLLTMGGSIGSPGINALFFTRVGVEFLPYMFIALAGLTIVTTLALTALLGRLSKKRLYLILPVVLGLSLIVARYLVGLDLEWVYPALWLGMYLYWTLQFLVAWGLASMVFDTRQAKRLFPLLAAAGILGTTIGGLVTKPLVDVIGAENLLIGWALAFFAATFVIRLALQDVQEAPLRSRWDQPSLVQDIQRGYKFVRKSELMRWVSAGALLMGTLLFFVVFPFSKGVTQEFPDEDAIAGFLGVFEGLTTAVAFFASLFLANRIYARIGFMGALLIFPVIYLLGFSASALYPAFATIAGLRFLQLVWRLGVADTAYQAIFNLVPSERREQTRAFIDGVPRQAGVALAGVLLLLGEITVEPATLFALGALIAAAAIFVGWRATQAYRGALAQALHAGQPQMFFSEEEPFGGYQNDASAVNVVVAGMSDPDPGVRRVSAEILGNLPVPEASQALVNSLDDPDPDVRAALLRSLAAAKATSALLDATACLADSEPEVRLEAVKTLHTLAGYPKGLLAQLEPLLDDPAPEVRSYVAITILKGGPHPSAPTVLEEMGSAQEPSTRVVVLDALESWGDPWGWDFASASLRDDHPSVRRAAAQAIVSIDPIASLELLIDALGDEDHSVQQSAAVGIGRVGPTALPIVVDALNRPSLESGALQALEQLLVHKEHDKIRRYAEKTSDRAAHYDGLWAGSREMQGLEVELFAHSLRTSSLRHARHALQAVGLMTDPEEVSLALENLESHDANQRANALEILDSLGHREVISVLIPIWETTPQPDGEAAIGLRASIEVAIEDDDPWVRACAALAAGPIEDDGLNSALDDLFRSDPDPLVREAAQRSLDGGSDMKVLPTLSIMERILFLQRVPMFSELPPVELKQVAAVAWENFYTEGDLIARQGESGDAMFIIVDGEVKVYAEDTREELALRGPGEYVGEMSIISQEPRMASLRAAGDVRMLCIGQKEFEGIIRERPETSLA
ncbi:MAG: HEAT repeat domain-containing protein, partial [Chloroflexi bacterium]|nr:HEAT repeat domain-containing protein [Chloroflexota bacterium]